MAWQWPGLNGPVLQAPEHWSKRALSMMVKKNTAKGGSALGCCISRSLFSHLYLFSTYGSMVGKKRPPKNNLPLCSTKHWQSRMQDWNRHSALTGCTTPGVFPLLTFTSLFCGRKWGRRWLRRDKSLQTQGKKPCAWWRAPRSRFCFTRNC